MTTPTTRFEHDGVRCAISHTVRDMLHFDLLSGRLAALESETEFSAGLVRTYKLIAAYSKEVRGLNNAWEPPPLHADAETVMASFEALLAAASSELLRAWRDAVVTVLNPAPAPIAEEDPDFLAPSG